MQKSIKSYMAIDLTVLILIGGLLEGLSAMFGPLVFFSTPTTYISMLIVFIAVIRWNLWGLITIPFLTICTIIGGVNGQIDTFKAFYNFGYTGWQAYVSMIFGMLFIGIDVIFFKKFSTKKVMHNNFAVIGLGILNYVLYNAVFLVAFRLLTSGGDLLHSGVILYDLGSKGTQNLCGYGESGFVSNLFSLAVMVVGTFILRSQGVATNVVEKLLDDKYNAELNELDRSFRIEEPIDSEDSINDAKDDPHGTEDSSKKSL